MVEILNAGGSLTGGSLRVSGNILSRKRLINEYKEKIDDKEIIIENAELNKFKEEIKSLKISVEKLELKLKSSEA